MKLKLPPAMLVYITKEIDHNRPLAALLRAAEYLVPTSELWNQLTQRALPKLQAHHYIRLQHFIPRLIAGATLTDFTAAERIYIQGFPEPRARVFQPISTSRRQRTLQQRGRRQPSTRRAHSSRIPVISKASKNLGIVARDAARSADRRSL